MGNLTHKAVRAAAGLGIDQILKHIGTQECGKSRSQIDSFDSKTQKCQ